MEHASDSELMILVVQRDARALAALYSRYELPIYNFLARYTGNRELAQDLLQETFTRVWCAAHQFDLKSGRFKAWLYKIALNLTRSEMAKKRYAHHYLDVSEIKPEEEPAHEGAESPEAAALENDLGRTLAKALGKLSPALREIIVLKHYQQLKFREIAEMTQTPEGTLKARFHRALAQLKELLEPTEL
jgi:RNA polymerase sigma-70 factor (ECF subfamily)